MIKAEFIKRVAKVSGESQVAVRGVLDAAAAVTCKAVSRGESIHLFGIGKLTVVARGEKRARNLHTGEVVMVPPRNVVTYQPSDVITRFANPQA